MTERIDIAFRRVRPGADDDIPPPRYMTEHSAGMDLRAAVDGEEILAAGEIRLIPTGFAVALPVGYEAQIRPRSGLAARHGIGLINAPGTIDADYRGEILIPLINLGREAFTLCRGDRIAQMVIQSVVQARVVLVDRLDGTRRGSGGFGHTGIS